MKLESLGAKGLFQVARTPTIDHRGLFERVFCLNELSEAWGNRSIVQINHTLTLKKGALRGFHFQHPPFGEMKMVQCLKGKVIDYAIDLRSGSDTFLKVFSLELTLVNSLAIIIPEGFAHGFQVLENNTELLYFHSKEYNSAAEGDLNFADPKLDIKLLLPISDISDRDRNSLFLKPDFSGIEY